MDFQKAYDNVSGEYLRFTLKKMGFGSKSLQWMEALVFNSSMSVLINGSPSDEF